LRADAPSVKDRYLVGSLAAGFVSLTLGVLGNALDLTQLGVIAGLSGFTAAIFGAAIGARMQRDAQVAIASAQERDR